MLSSSTEGTDKVISIVISGKEDVIVRRQREKRDEEMIFKILFFVEDKVVRLFLGLLGYKFAKRVVKNWV